MSCSPSSCLPLNDLVNFHRSSSAPAAPPCATPPKLPPTDVERPTNVVHSQHQALLSGLIWHEGEIKSSVFGIFQLGRVTCLMSCWESQAPTGRAAECGHVHCTYNEYYIFVLQSILRSFVLCEVFLYGLVIVPWNKKLTRENFADQLMNTFILIFHFNFSCIYGSVCLCDCVRICLCVCIHTATLYLCDLIVKSKKVWSCVEMWTHLEITLLWPSFLRLHTSPAQGVFEKGQIQMAFRRRNTVDTNTMGHRRNGIW